MRWRVVDIHGQLDAGAGAPGVLHEAGDVGDGGLRRRRCDLAGAILVEHTDHVAQLERLAGGRVDEPGGAFDLGRWEI